MTIPVRRWAVLLVLVCVAAWLAGCGSAQVPAVNQNPLANAGDDVNGTAGSTITLNALGSSDPDGDSLSYQWEQTLGQPVQITNANQPVATFVPAAADTYEFTVTVTDGNGGSDTDTVRCSIGTEQGPGDTDPPADPGTLAGTFAGTVTYAVGLKLNDGQPQGRSFTEPLSVTFDAQGQPSVVDVPFDAGQVAVLPCPNGLRQGDTLQTVLTQGSGEAITTINVSARVASVTSNSASLEATLEVTVEYVGLQTVTGGYTIKAAGHADGTVSWNGSGELSIPVGQAAMSAVMTAKGTLVKKP